MKKGLTSILLIGITSIFLPSCAGGDAPYCIYQNPTIVDAPNTYQDVCIEVTGSEIISMLEDDKDVLFLFSSDDCSHCAFFEEDFTRVIKETLAECYLIHLTEDNYVEYQNSVRLLEEYFDEDLGATPAVYVGSGNTLTTITYGSTSYSEFRATLTHYVDINPNVSILPSIESYEQEKDNVNALLASTYSLGLNSFLPNYNFKNINTPIYVSYFAEELLPSSLLQAYFLQNNKTYSSNDEAFYRELETYLNITISEK